MARRRQRGGAHKHPSVRKPRVTLTGTIRLVRPGLATVETPEGTYTVARGGIREAMGGDEVQVVLVHRGKGEAQAVVHGVLQRATQSFLGTYELAEPLGVVVPLDPRIHHDFFVLPDDTSAERLGVAEGDVVSARILQYPARQSAGVVTLDRRVGKASQLDMAMERVIAGYGLATEFPESVLAQAEGLSLDVDAALSHDPLRRDLRRLVTFTIDPADARDFDDAVAAVQLEQGGYEVAVHIADVTSYLPWSSPMDVEARRRTCSTYLADRVIPMLPERLCNDLCSLRPAEDRLAMSVLMTLDERCEVVSAQVGPSVIRSRARLDYDTVDRLLEGKASLADLACEAQVAPEVAQMIGCLDAIAQERRRIRAKRGAVDFDTRESKVLLDAKGHPVGARLRERTRATSLVEEAMLMANEAVARLLAEADVQAAYRVHERPAPESLQATLPVLHEFGLLQPGDAERLVAGDPFAAQDVLGRARGTSAEYLASAVLLRAQKRAVYLPHNDGHYALGARAYCHFTSPIRRYPDVIVHRAVKALLSGQLGSKEQREVARQLPQLCRTCSDQERVADSASRDSQKAKMAELYEGRVGEACSGIVVGVERFGLFVVLDDTGAEGLLPTRALGEEWFTHDEDRFALVGESTGRTWRLGQRVAVEVAGANPARGQIDFVLAAGRRPGNDA